MFEQWKKGVELLVEGTFLMAVPGVGMVLDRERRAALTWWREDNKLRYAVQDELRVLKHEHERIVGKKDQEIRIQEMELRRLRGTIELMKESS